MIFGTLNTSATIHESFQNSDFLFYLTGSRYFGGAEENSDWDFFVQYDDNVVKFLVSLGFELRHATEYKDTELVKFMRHKEKKIDVQLVKDAALKMLVQILLASEPMRRHYNGMVKITRWYLWDFAYQIFTCNFPWDAGHEVIYDPIEGDQPMFPICQQNITEALKGCP